MARLQGTQNKPLFIGGAVVIVIVVAGLLWFSGRPASAPPGTTSGTQPTPVGSPATTAVPEVESGATPAAQGGQGGVTMPTGPATGGKSAAPAATASPSHTPAPGLTPAPHEGAAAPQIPVTSPTVAPVVSPTEKPAENLLPAPTAIPEPRRAEPRATAVPSASNGATSNPAPRPTANTMMVPGTVDRSGTTAPAPVEGY